MSTLPASQTLFRFVSLRSPQLSDEVGKSQRFIYRPLNVASQPGTINVFDAAVQQNSTESKWQQLLSAAPAFKASPAYIASEANLSDTVGSGLFQFSIWLARHRDDFTNAEFSEKVTAANTTLSIAVLTRLWNNLFYQVATQESFYLKESLMQVLQALHVLKNAAPIENEGSYVINQTIALAKIVLPKELFLFSEGPLGISSLGSREADTSDNGSVPSVGMSRSLAITAANRLNKKYSNLKTTIQSIEEQYRREYQKNYKNALKLRETNTKMIMDQYALDKEAALKQWCKDRDPSIPKGEDDPCNVPPVIPMPELPTIDFSFTQETEYLANQLTPEGIALVNTVDQNNNYAKNAPPASAGPNEKTIQANSFARIYENIDNAISNNNETIIENTGDSRLPIIMIGGIPIPVVWPGVDTSTPFTYQICPTPDGGEIIWSMRIFVPDRSYVFSRIEYSNVYPNPTTFSTYVGNPSTNTNPIVLPELFGGGPLIFLQNDPDTTISGTIYFGNGIQKTFQANVSGQYPKCVKGTLGDIKTDNPPTPTPPVFKPTGFGVKQLGVADYRKVEQSVHCYVEGEVAHIENIMAREYREKSTRRLRRSESNTTTSSESEREQLTDTTSTDRFEMQNEIANIIQESKDLSANVNVRSTGVVSVDAGASFATHSSKEQSTRAAITQAKDLTERAMDRVVSRVKQERIDKIIEEFEENNKHGFDNTKGDKHVVGVYRWVDKIYKNQIYNYGKRLMFEFMIPEPARLHVLGIQSVNANANITLAKPTDPRTSAIMNLRIYTNVTTLIAEYWSGIFNVEVPKPPKSSISIGKSFSFTTTEIDDDDYDEPAAGNADIELPEGYVTTHVTAAWYYANEGGRGFKAIAGPKVLDTNEERTPIAGFTNHLPVSYHSLGFHSGSVNFKVELELTTEAETEWKKKTFKIIIDAFEKELGLYNDALAQQQAIAANIKSTNPGFYRQIENTVLRKNCISYLIDQNPTSPLSYGQKMYRTATPGTESFSNYEVNLSPALDNYSSFARFLEQAFEWDIMSYYFYPFYWANRPNWEALYQFEDNDPLFRSFMQSGMARVIVTVRPGFEDAVRFYMQTGLVWNGGEVPVIDDPLHLSIVDELRAPLGQPEGKAWATRIPTSLTILQADSIGLVVEKALPCNCDDVSPETWENADKVPCGDSFVISKSPMNGNSATTIVQFSFVDMDDYQTVADLDTFGFPRTYQCMGRAISVQRNAAWDPNSSAIVVYQQLAQQLSQVPGIAAEQNTSGTGNVSGIRFTVDASIISQFEFTKPGESEVFDQLIVAINSDSLRFDAPTQYYDRIMDRLGTKLQGTEIGASLPITRFKV